MHDVPRHRSVVLSDQLLRQLDLWTTLRDQTKIILQDPDPADQGETKSPARQVQRRLTPADQVAVVDHYQAGATIKVLALEFGVHRVTISRYLKQLAVPLRVRGIRPEHVPEAARLYMDGWSLERLGEKYGCDHTTVWRALRERGVQLRPRPGWDYG